MHPPSPVQKVRQQVYRLVAVQFGLIILASLVTGLLVDASNALSVILGGLCVLLPHVFFAWKFFRRGGATALKSIMSAFYWGEILKLLLTAVLFIVILKTLQPEIPAFLVGFGLAQAGIFLAPFIMK